MKYDDLKAKIRIAFKDEKLGDGISLNQTEYLDSYKSDQSYLELAQFDERENWQNISDATLEKFTCTFSFTDAAGFKFYLPAYMIWTLNNYLKKSYGIIGDLTIYALNLDHYTIRKNNFFKMFNFDQIQCIIEFLEFAIENDGYTDGVVARENLKKITSAQQEFRSNSNHH